MSLFLQRTFDSLANGTIYAGLAVAISLVFRSTGVLNLAQGQMALFSTYVAVLFASEPSPRLAFTSWVDDFGTPWPIWASIVAAMIVSFIAGALIERVVIRPLGDDDPVPSIGATLGLFLLFDSFIREHWLDFTRRFGSPFPNQKGDWWVIGGARLEWDTVGIAATMIVALGLLALLQHRTRLGLAFRAVSSNRQSSTLAGIRVDRVVMIGWALAAALGALGGGLIAGQIPVRPGMMDRVLILGLAAVTLGGLRSPAMAFVGGYLFAATETVMSGYIGFIDTRVTLVWALAVLIAVLSIRPQGLLRTHKVAIGDDP